MIPELDESMNPADADLGQYFDVDGAVLSNDVNMSQDLFGEQLPEAPTDVVDFLTSEWDVSGAGDTILSPEDAPDYSKFENWIPLFVRPESACDYCRARHLDCYMRRGVTSCNPCNSLFRECSLAKTHAFDDVDYIDKASGAFIDTLHVVDEDNCREQGTLTGVKPLRSKGTYGGTATPPVRPDDAPGSSKRNGIRFPRQAVKILRDWLDAHAERPYPTEEEKGKLEKRTELTPAQIANWLANARRRTKIAKSRPKRCISPSLGPSTPSIAIPGTASKESWDQLNPLERWKNSPPEHEPAPFTAIADAVARSDLPEEPESSSLSSGRAQGSSNGSGLSLFRALSTTSMETGKTSSSSSAAFSHGSSRSYASLGSFGSFNSSLAGKRDHRRRRRPVATPSRKLVDDKKRMFQCTFCTDTFKSKYDWTRHEKSLHLSLEKWLCAPLGPLITDPASGKKKCVYCGALDVDDDHGETHNHRQCEDKGRDARTFFRKDHLRQHLRLMHGCEMKPEMDTWKSIALNINSRCGFCSQRFTVWSERTDHLTSHFKSGVGMKEWKGCRGLDPAVAAQVTNAMPPYLIGIESVTPNPFSATNEGHWNADALLRCDPTMHEFDTGGNLVAAQKLDYSNTNMTAQRAYRKDAAFGTIATCWEILTVRLGKYANQQAEKGVVLTDEMLQSQARCIFYGSDDGWNQTAADNPEWLDLFRKAHGLDYIPNMIGGTGREIPEDLETYGDLGLRIPFSVQLEKGEAFGTEDYQVPEAYQRSANDRRRKACSDVYQQFSTEGVLHTDEQSCGHTKCMSSFVDATALAGGSAESPRQGTSCTQQLSLEQAEMLTTSMSGSDSAVPLVQAMAADEVDNDSRLKQARAQGRNALLNLDSRLKDTPAGKRGAGVCRSRSYQSNDEAARARVPCLYNLANNEASEGDTCADHSSYAGSAYMRRHQLELPPDKAVRFATTTRASPDSGILGEQITNPLQFATLGTTATSSSIMTWDTPSSAYQAGKADTTGAMMEFLGSNLGEGLPFSTDVNTSNLDAGTLSCFEQEMPLYAMIQEGAIDIGAESVYEPTHINTQAGDIQAIVTSSEAVSFDDMLLTSMDGMEMPSFGSDKDLNDLDFDSIFDMPMDDHFGNLVGDQEPQR